jgi:DNA-binding protein HU-beta
MVFLLPASTGYCNENHATGHIWYGLRLMTTRGINMAEKTDKPKVLTVPLSKIIAEIAANTEMPKKSVVAVVDELISQTIKNLKKGNKVRLTGLGIMQVRKRPARMGRNPATGEAIKIKASKKVAFRVAKDLKEAV